MYIIFGHMNNLQAIQEGVLSLMQKNVHLVLMNCMEVQKRLHNIVEEFPFIQVSFDNNIIKKIFDV